MTNERVQFSSVQFRYEALYALLKTDGHQRNKK